MNYNTSLFTIMKQVAFIVIMTLTAVGITTVLFYNISEPKEQEVTELADIGGSYGVSAGYHDVTQFEESPNQGIVSRTIGANLSVIDESAVRVALSMLQEDVATFGGGEIVNLNIAVEVGEKNYVLNYFAGTAFDYSDGTFDETKNVFSSFVNSNLSTATVTVTPTLQGSHTHVYTQTKDFTVNNQRSTYNNVVAAMQNNYTFSVGDVYNLNYDNLRTDGESGETVSTLSVQEIYDTPEQLENAREVNFIYVNNLFNSSQYSSFRAVQVKHVSTPESNSKQIIVVVPDEEGFDVGAIEDEVTAASSDSALIRLPEPFDVIFRHTLDGENFLFFNNYFAE